MSTIHYIQPDPRPYILLDLLGTLVLGSVISSLSFFSAQEQWVLEGADRRTATMADGMGTTCVMVFLILGNIFGAVRVALDFIPIVAVFF